MIPRANSSDDEEEGPGPSSEAWNPDVWDPEVVRRVSLPPLPPSPIHADQGARKGPPEPLVPVAPGLHARMRHLYTFRAGRPPPRIVYDSLDPPPPLPSSIRTLEDAQALPRCRLPDEAVPQNPWYAALPGDATVVFESRFESGNLRRAIQIEQNEYDLILRPDINSEAHTQWYYFGMSNLRRGQAYKLNIINLTKDASLYNAGMLPCVFSVKQFQSRGRGWHREGTDVCYYQNEISRRNGKKYYTLTMTLTPQHEGDTLYLAHCFPYTYKDLQTDLHRLRTSSPAGRCVSVRPLTHTLAGVAVPLVTITAPRNEGRPLPARRVVAFTARVHPGESNASWVMRGLLTFLAGDSDRAQALRRRFVFEVVPMLNPDGVVHGNYRCSLAGIDLNRTWAAPSKDLHPETFAARALFESAITGPESAGLELLCDLHGHSRKRNAFMYGCCADLCRLPPPPPGRSCGAVGQAGAKVGVPSDLQSRMYPFLVSQAAPESFSYPDCSFVVQRSKEATARVVGWRELGLCNSFTLEVSFAGPSLGPFAGTHFTISQLESLGAAMGQALGKYEDPDPCALSRLVPLVQDADMEAATMGAIRAVAANVDDEAMALPGERLGDRGRESSNAGTGTNPSRASSRSRGAWSASRQAQESGRGRPGAGRVARQPGAPGTGAGRGLGRGGSLRRAESRGSVKSGPDTAGRPQSSPSGAKAYSREAYADDRPSKVGLIARITSETGTSGRGGGAAGGGGKGRVRVAARVPEPLSRWGASTGGDASGGLASTSEVGVAPERSGRRQGPLEGRGPGLSRSVDLPASLRRVMERALGRAQMGNAEEAAMGAPAADEGEGRVSGDGGPRARRSEERVAQPAWAEEESADGSGEGRASSWAMRAVGVPGGAGWRATTGEGGPWRHGPLVRLASASAALQQLPSGSDAAAAESSQAGAFAAARSAPPTPLKHPTDSAQHPAQHLRQPSAPGPPQGRGAKGGAHGRSLMSTPGAPYAGGLRTLLPGGERSGRVARGWERRGGGSRGASVAPAVGSEASSAGIGRWAREGPPGEGAALGAEAWTALAKLAPFVLHQRGGSVGPRRQPSERGARGPVAGRATRDVAKQGSMGTFVSHETLRTGSKARQGGTWGGGGRPESARLRGPLCEAST